ncbi:SURF1-like protein [Microtetraspora sp. NBRC 13810]|uniref:SURF1 family protein n=1 Tax=Microtetraspora sp. NBRC 13810 TaxID=3030990 RepID=UPI0024A01B04|nr:SURF1 family protein [Microtetraspora sp. NBRC 13810]GLW05256.1 SURF1-like protein [Microtetraspora sp. NBRC 13810]
MLRTVFLPRMVALHLLTIGVLVSFTLLGRWQLGVFEDSGRPQAARDPAPVPVATLAGSGRQITVDAASRRVTAQGTFDASRQLLVAGRDDGFWLLNPLDLGDGTAVPVVRGWVPATSDPAVRAVPPGPVTVAGRLQPSEPTDMVQRRPQELPRGQVLTVSTAELVNIWPGVRLRDGYVVASAQNPAPAVAAKAVTVPPPTVGGALTWRNLAYAAQWWIFALFAVFMWWHFLRDAIRSREAEAEQEPPQAPDNVALSPSHTR